MNTTRGPVFLMLLVFLGCGRKEQDPALQFTFTAYGDCRKHHDVHQRICDSMLKTRPKYVLVTGDLVGDGDNPEHWDTFQTITRELRAAAGYHPVHGDHDGKTSGFLQKEFGLDKRYYEKKIENIHFFFLDSTALFRDPEQLEWFAGRAAASTALHRIAVFHHPPFANEPDRAPQQEAVRGRIHALLVKHQFCAAFCGHEHAFYTTLRDGVRYVVTGGGGAPLSNLDPASAQKGDLWKTFFHYVGCRVEAGRITARVVDQYGAEAIDLAFTVCEHSPARP